MNYLSILVASPSLALLPAITFAVIGYRRHRALPWVAAVAWLLYGLYETGMQQRVLCSGECNIRIDLLALYPLLGGLSLAAAISACRVRRVAA